MKQVTISIPQGYEDKAKNALEEYARLTKKQRIEEIYSLQLDYVLKAPVSIQLAKMVEARLASEMPMEELEAFIRCPEMPTVTFPLPVVR